MWKVTLVPCTYLWANYDHVNGSHRVEFKQGIAYTNDKVLIDEFCKSPNKYIVEKMDDERG